MLGYCLVLEISLKISVCLWSISFMLIRYVKEHFNFTSILSMSFSNWCYRWILGIEGTRELFLRVPTSGAM